MGGVVVNRVVKVVVTGPVNAGKTTLIRTLSDVPVVCTNESATDDVAGMKDLTTVAMDHGICYPSEGMELHLYGTPGQRRFDFMWEILAVGAHAILFLVDGSDPESIEEVSYIYDHFGERINIPELILVTKSDLEGALSPADVAARMGIDPSHVVACDPRSTNAAKATLLSFIESQKLEVCEPII
nr:GTP-binding protein [Mariprofundus sp. KV]